MAECPGCGKEVKELKFCPFCGTPLEGKATRAMGVPSPTPPPPPTDETIQMAGPPVEAAPPTPPFAAPPVPTATPGVFLPPPAAPVQAAPGKKRAALWVTLVVLALALIAGGVVLAVLLTREGGVKVEIENPGPGEEVSGATLNVEVSVTEPVKVGRVALYVDGVMKASVSHSPFKAQVPSGNKGKHQLTAAAYDPNGKMLDEAALSFETTRASKGDEDGTKKDGQKKAEDYKNAVAVKASEMSSIDSQIRTMANRINSELSHRRISAGLLTETQSLYNKTVNLYSGAQSLNPPGEMISIQTQLLQLCEYLRTRADALVKGCEAANAGGKYTSEFNRGANAKNSYEAAWPNFQNACRAVGINV